MLERFRCDVRVKNYVLLNYGKTDEPAPELYLKNNNLDMVAANNVIESTINRFSTKLTSLFKISKQKRKGTNMTRLQENMIRCFQQHPEFTALLSSLRF